MWHKILVFEFQSRKHLLFSIARGDLCCLSFTTKNLCMADSMSYPQKYNKQNLTHRETTLAPAVAIKLSSLLIDMRRKKKIDYFFVA